MTVAILIGVVIGVVIVAAAVARSRRSRDGVDTFRRQIDALSPEARRPVVDQVQSAAGRVDADDDPGDQPPDGDAASSDGDGDDAADDGGARGA